MKRNLLSPIATVLSLISLATCIIGTSIPYWLYASSDTSSRASGLWAACDTRPNSRSCSTYSGTVDGWVHTVRAMEIIGILLIAFASACGALKYFIVKDNDKIVQIAGASAFAAGVFMGIGVIIFGIKYHDPPKFISEYPFSLHAGYWLCVIASALAVVSGFMYMFAYVLRR